MEAVFNWLDTEAMMKMRRIQTNNQHAITARFLGEEPQSVNEALSVIELHGLKLKTTTMMKLTVKDLSMWHLYRLKATEKSLKEHYGQGSFWYIEFYLMDEQ